MKMSFDHVRTDWSCATCLDRSEKVSVKSVNIVSLDSLFFNKTTPNFYVLKTDTQGHELSVLRGAQNLIKAGRIKYILVEFDPTLLRKAGTNPNYLVRWLYRHNFYCMDLMWEPTSKSEFSPPLSHHAGELAENLLKHSPYGYTDLFCSHFS